MNPLVTMSLRNVGRNKRRTLITIITIILGVVVVIQVRGLINGLQGEVIENRPNTSAIVSHLIGVFTTINQSGIRF